MLTIKTAILAVLFVISGGAAFARFFHGRALLEWLAGIVASLSFFLLFKDIVREELGHLHASEPSVAMTAPAVTPAPLPPINVAPPVTSAPPAAPSPNVAPPAVPASPKPVTFSDNSTMPKTFTNSIGMEFVLIPGGKFIMGTDCIPAASPGCSAGETPPHEVTIQAFYMGKYEVTQAQWYKVMQTNPAYFNVEKLNSDTSFHPIENVNWEDAQAFIKRLNALEKTDKYYLPSEAQWEYAARGGTQTAYFFGDNDAQLGEYAWYDKNSEGKTHPVGQKKPNPFGLYDIVGNVWEWTQDEWHENYNDAPTDGNAWVSGWLSRVGSSKHVLRGGSWYNDTHYCRSANRGRYVDQLNNFGFRVVVLR